MLIPYDGNQLGISAESGPVDTNDYFYVEAAQDNCQVQFLEIGSPTVPYVLEYSFDKKTWHNFTANSSVTIPTTGSKLYIRGDNPNAKMGANVNNRNCITSEQNHKLGGNVMSLVDKTCQETAVSERMFLGLFASVTMYDMNMLDSIADLKLNFTSVGAYGCAYMFQNRGYFTEIPALPATRVESYGYAYMFYACKGDLSASSSFPSSITLGSHAYERMFSFANVVNPPAMPNTNLKASACAYMFKDSKKLTTPPELPATVMYSNVYQSMFENCTALSAAPALPATSLATTCYSTMFKGCTALSSAPELKAKNMQVSCYNSMFQGCTALTSAPALSSKSLATSCYASMFNGCTSLSAAPELPATDVANSAYSSMFNSCTSLTEPPIIRASSLNSTACNTMFAACANLRTPPILSATTLANGCYNSMFQGCYSLSATPELPATDLAQNCYKFMFAYCTSLSAAPYLPATTLVSGCYDSMFRGDRLIDSISAAFTEWEPSGAVCTDNWVTGVNASGTFTCNATLPEEYGDNRIPSGWIRDPSL